MLRGNGERAFTLQVIVHVIVEHLAVIDGGDAVPGAEGILLVAVEQGARLVADDGEGVEAPFGRGIGIGIGADADLEEHALGWDVLAGGGVGGLEMEDALFGPAVGVGTEDHLPGPGGGAGEGMDIDEESGVGAVEGDGLALGRVDEGGRADNVRGVAADGGEIVEAPELRPGGLRGGGEGAERDGEDCEEFAGQGSDLRG